MFVEASIVLPIFMIAVLSFISLTDLYITHARMQYAISMAARETASYTYFYSYLGLRDIDVRMQQANEDNLKNPDGAIGNMVGIMNSTTSILNSIISDTENISNGGKKISDFGQADINAYSQNFNSIVDNTEALSGFIDDFLNDPKQVVSWILGYCANSAKENGKTALGAYLLYPALTYKYLGYDSSAVYDKGGENISNRDAFLKNINISNVDFSNSSLLPQILVGGKTDNSLNARAIDIVVTYDYTLPLSILPKEASTFHIVQRSVTLGWGDGDSSHK